MQKSCFKTPACIAPSITQVCLGGWTRQEANEVVPIALVATIFAMEEAFVPTFSALPVGYGLPG